MKVLIPESINDITLGQYQKYVKLQERTDIDAYGFDKRKIEIFCGVPFQEVDKISIEDLKSISDAIDLALNQTVAFTPTFSMYGIKMGMIPNFEKDKLTAKEYIDMTSYAGDVENLHKLMAVLFRPIKYKKQNFIQKIFNIKILEEDLTGYKIADYNGTEEYANVMKSMPLSIVNSSLVFFSSLANELEQHIQKFIMEEQKKATEL
jgi:hypothetical protein